MINLFLKFFSLASFYFLSSLPVLAERLPNPLGNNDPDPQMITANIIKAMLGVTGILATAMFVWGGLLWTSSAGAKDKIKQGQDTMLWSIIGLIVVFAAYALVNTVLKLISF